ncbi:hypothetical protein GPECTOR_4g825 [Gonium pectorale]|uniref:WH1 domain-containing protein n=1 Tax=Gonium pectorale TaxID=33097 RepID=A0A150GY67_GONPE|nr:hypothetical protein GPECTOR_4g825 [Gonium pectorale]|eukprot:KXZ54755.1 hypothetical protein GPECTOR_4g825 [Gonium pectorale]
MSVAAQQWVRKDVEGSLFVIKRRTAPRYQMLVLNKQSTQNYVEDIHSGMDFEVNPPYLMYTHGNSEIVGVWFYEQNDLYTVEQVLTKIKEVAASEASPSLLNDFLKQQADLVGQAPGPEPSVNGRALASSAVEPSADEDSFWDKPKAKPRPQPQVPAPAAGAQAPSAAPGSIDGGSNLANLLRNAQLKQQQQLQQQQPTALEPAAATGGPQQPMLLPPSFFAQRAAAPVAPQATAPPAQAPGLSPPPPQRPAEQVQPPPQPRAPALPPGEKGAALVKLFANANKGAAAARPLGEPAPVAPAAPAPAPAVHAAAPPSTPPPAAQPVPAPHAAAGGVISDEERVRRLLTRIATNEGLVKLLAAEMRAVGLL